MSLFGGALVLLALFAVPAVLALLFPVVASEGDGAGAATFDFILYFFATMIVALLAVLGFLAIDMYIAVVLNLPTIGGGTP